MWLKEMPDIVEKKSELVRRIHACDEYLSKIDQFIAKTKSQYESGKLTYLEYARRLHYGLAGRSTNYWLRYYTRHMKKYKQQLRNYSKKAKTDDRNRKLLALALVVGIVALTGFASVQFDGFGEIGITAAPIASPVSTADTGLRAQNCAGEINQGSAGTFNNGCAGTYPANPDNLEADDTNLEAHNHGKNKYAGINITAYNSSAVCDTVDSVYLCYKWWGDPGETYANCRVGVDAGGDSSWTTINSTCPETSETGGVVCTNVTLSETWGCGSFFGASGTRAMAMAEAQRTSTGGGTDLTIDVLYFNVSYTEPDSTSPLVTINFPTNTTYSSADLPLNFNITLNEDGDTVLYTMSSGISNITMSSTDNREYNATNETIADDTYTFQVYANDTAANRNDTTSIVFSVDQTAPTITNADINETSTVVYGTIVKVNASVSDAAGNLETVLLEIRPPSGSGYNTTPDQSGTEWYNDTVLLDVVGQWVFVFFANDTHNQASVTTATDLASNAYIDASDTLPTLDSQSLNDTVIRKGDVANFTAIWSDVTALDSYIFATDISGSWINSSAIAFTGTQNTSENISTIPTVANTTIQWRFIANDSYGNMTHSAIQSFGVVSGFLENSSWGQEIEALNLSSVVYGDFTGDGQIDIITNGIVYGSNFGSPNFRGRAYTSNGTVLVRNTSWDQELVGAGDAVLVDIDNDGDLDLFVSNVSSDNSDPGAHLIFAFINNDTSFKRDAGWEQGLLNSTSLLFGDIDKDGDLDMLTVGSKDANFDDSHIYLNNGSSLVEDAGWDQNLPFDGDHVQSQLIDVDNDADLDIALIGTDGSTGSNITHIYLNNGTSFNSDAGWNQSLLGIVGSNNPSVAAGDIDDDKDMDLVVLGSDRVNVYINNGTSFVDNTNWSQNLTPKALGIIKLGDIDNDGKLDIFAVSDNSGGSGVASKVYINNGTAFNISNGYSKDLTTVGAGGANLFDLDKDNDLDAIIMGSDGTGASKGYQILINDITDIKNNAAPTAPDTFSTIYAGTTLNITWNNGSDTETASDGLYYHVRIGTCAGCDDILSTKRWSTGINLEGQFGNMQQIRSINLSLTDQNMYWAVQTIDAGYRNSTFSAEQSYVAANAAPEITDISALAAQSVTESGITNVEFSILASDTDGAGELDNTTINTTFFRAGEDMRYNTSCNTVGTINSTTNNYTCTVGIQYWDAAGDWAVNATILDSSAAQSTSFNESFTLNEFTAIKISPATLTWTELTAGTANQLSNNDPILVNNTGNDDITSGNVKLTAYDLVGEETTTEAITSGNFTAKITDACEGTQMVNATATSITSSILTAGNNTINAGDATSGQEQLYLCLEDVPETLQAQAYATLISWIVSLA